MSFRTIILSLSAHLTHPGSHLLLPIFLTVICIKIDQALLLVASDLRMTFFIVLQTNGTAPMKLQRQLQHLTRLS